MLNRVFLIGRLTRDPERRQTPQGNAVANFTLAVDRGFSSSNANNNTDFIKVVTWNKVAENCVRYLTKGSLVFVEGRLQIRSYEDANKIRRTVAEVVAKTVQFLDKKKKEPSINSNSESDLEFSPEKFEENGTIDDLDAIDGDDYWEY